MITVVAAVSNETTFSGHRRVKGRAPGRNVGVSRREDRSWRDASGGAQRELLEELDTAADVGELVFDTTHDYGDVIVRLFFYTCSLIGTPRPAARTGDAVGSAR